MTGVVGIEQAVTRAVSPGEITHSEPLERLRAEIDEIDRSLIALVARRVAVARAIGEAKRDAELPTLDPAREARLVRWAGSLARDAGLEPEGVRALFWQLIAISRNAQDSEANAGAGPTCGRSGEG